MALATGLSLIFSDALRSEGQTVVRRQQVPGDSGMDFLLDGRAFIRTNRNGLDSVPLNVI
jgi:hypothetical protein